MVIKVFSVYDVKAGAYMTPFFAQTSGIAQREFMLACRKEGHIFNDSPADYTLFELGEFKPDSGALEGRIPERMITGLECLQYEDPTQEDE